MSKAPKLRFKEFSGEWEEKKLGELSNLITKGTTPSSIGFQFTNEGINFIKTENIDKNGYIRIDETPKISQECNEKLSRSILNEGDILFSIAGTLGRTCLIEKEHLPANTNQALAIVRLTESVSNKYLNSYLNLDKIKRYIDISVSVGAQPNINLQQVADIKVNIPSKEEQEKIASFLSLIDDKISLQGEKVEALKDYKKGMMQKIFSRESRFKDDDGRDYPEWEKKKLGELATIQRGASPRPIADSKWFDENSKIGWVRISDVTSSNIYLEKVTQYLSDEGVKKSRLLEKPHLILSIAASVGKPIINKIPVCIHDGFIVFKNLSIDILFGYYFLIMNQYKWENYKQPGTQFNLNSDLVANMEIAVPCKDEQKKISKLLNKIDNKLEKEQEKLDYLNEYKKGLLQQMFV